MSKIRTVCWLGELSEKEKKIKQHPKLLKHSVNYPFLQMEPSNQKRSDSFDHHRISHPNSIPKGDFMGSYAHVTIDSKLEPRASGALSRVQAYF